MQFRYANKNDVKLILDFIKRLAIYEKMENDVVATEELLYDWLFVKKVANVLFVMENDKEVGFALYFYNFSTFLGKAGIYLEDLYVLEQYRNKGYGKGLLHRLATICVEENLGRLEWSCLDWNTPSINFYLSIGAKCMDGWSVYRLTGDTLQLFAKEGIK